MLLKTSLPVIPPGEPIVSLPIEVAARLRLGNRIRARSEVREGVEPVRGRRHHDRCDHAQIVGTTECDRRVRNARFATVLGAIVVGVDVNITREARGLQFAKCVARRGRAGGQYDAQDRVRADAARDRHVILGVGTIQIAGRLGRLGDCVSTRQYIIENIIT